MKQGEIYYQVDGWSRYTYECPRGTLAIDEVGPGEVRWISHNGTRSQRARDLREALALHASIMAEELEEERSRPSWDEVSA